METRKAIDGKATGLMILLCVIWGLQQVVLKAAAGDMSPVLQIALRSGLASVMVAGLIRLRGGRIFRKDGSWRLGLLSGFLFALEYLLVGEALRFTTVSHSVVFLYTAPIFAALGLHLLLPEERLKLVQWLGIAVAFTGIVITFYGRDGSSPEAASDLLLGDLLALLGGLAWGATTVVIRCTRLSGIPATSTLLYQLTGAFVFLMLATFILGQSDFRLTSIVWASMSFQVLVVSFASLLVWFWLLRNYLASRLGVLAFLTPIFGVIFGIFLLNEPVEKNFIIGSLLVFAGIMLVSGYEWLHHKLKKTSSPKSAN